ncbi:MAG: Trk system potassium transporter TrkA [Pseudomonadota bacterium]|nr:Trk system potassium transporter TrkA [Pseudomonadota bacterium]
MKIVILGAGQVGSTLAENLAGEHHDVTLVDLDESLLRDLQDRLDVRTVVGSASYPAVLRQAGADSADMIIAVTDNDEVNIIACQVAYSVFNTPVKIARVRSQHYFIGNELFGNANLPIDVFISPETLVTNYIKELIDHPGALQVLNFAEGKVKLVALKPHYGGPLVGKSLKNLKDYVSGVEMRVAAIFRENRSIPLSGSTIIEVGDEVFFIAASENIRVVMTALGRVFKSYKHIIIGGGGNIGSNLAAQLENDYEVKLIDHNRENCEQLSQHLTRTIVLHGDVTDKDLLFNENIEHTDVFCAVTSDDEANIMAALQAHRLGARQVMALINRRAYVDLIEGGRINMVISPQQATISSILAQIRRGDVVGVHSLRGGAAEAIEAIAHGDNKTSKVVGKTIAEIILPKATTIGAIVRSGEVIIPHHDTVIESEDHVILFVSDKSHVQDVERMFSVQVTYL